jgi:hypothetical protein
MVEEWQLHLLVPGSLFILYFIYVIHRFPTLRKLRALVWTSYVGGDALAIYGLATLFNRHKLQGRPTKGAGGEPSVYYGHLSSSSTSVVSHG